MFLLNINVIYIIYIYAYIIDAPETLRSQGFLENDAPDAPAPCNNEQNYLCTVVIELWPPTLASFPLDL
jgi:hypothetical protein